MQLRPYQEQAVGAVLEYCAEGGGTPLVEMATGCGKSLVIAELCRRLLRQFDGFRILSITHVKELIVQNFEELKEVWPLAPAGIHSAGVNYKALSLYTNRESQKQIIFAGIQTAHRVADQFGSVDVLIIDEAHLVGRNAASMYGKFIALLLSINPNMRVVGLTATPFRLGSGRLDQGDGALFDRLVFTYGIADGVRDGYLARLVSKATETGFDLTGVQKAGGEYVQAQLQVAVDKEETTRRAVEESIAYGRGRKSWLAFCSGVEHAFHVRNEIRRRGFSCETVTGKTPSEERRRILEDFKSGKLRCVTNNSVLTTGFNAPGVDLIMALRPTASASLYVQMMGRGTRCAQGKDNCLVLDFAGLIRTHGPVDQVKPPGESKGGGVAPIKECPQCHSLLHASLMVCPDCSYVFVASAVSKLTAKASALAVMGNAPAEWTRVSSRSFAINYRPKDTALLQVTFVCGQVKHRAWFMPEWGMRKGNKADKFWIEHGGKMPCPRTAVSWVSRQAELGPTSEINIEPNGAKIKVLDSRAVLVMSVAAE